MVAAFTELGVARVGPTHCTGPDAIRQVREACARACIDGSLRRVVAVQQGPGAGRGYQFLPSLR